MARPRKTSTKKTEPVEPADYERLVAEVAEFIEGARRSAARSVNALMTATYWLVGERIVHQDQGGQARAGYGDALLRQLSADLTERFGRGFSERNLEQMRAFHLGWPISQTASAKSLPPRGIEQVADISQTASAESIVAVAARFPLPWSHYVRLLAVKNENARAFYEDEALRGGWTVRQLDRQIQSQFYERTAISRNKASMLAKGARPQPEDLLTPEEEIKDPYVLEFLDLKDEYSESDMEDALIRHLETFLMELGGDFAFVGRQRRLRVGDAWYRIDLLFFHRRLRCLVVIDLKLGSFSHADAGQMHLYLNYAREHWTLPDENPPVGLILCAEKDHAVAKYALEGLPNKVLATEYRTALPNERVLVEEIETTKRQLDARGSAKGPKKKTAARKGKSRC